MGDKNKILAQNEEALRNAPHPVQSKLSPEQIGKIYRAPKTRRQLREDDARRQVMFRSRLPRWAPLKIASLSTILLAILLAYLMTISALWASGSIAGVFFSFALFLIIGFAYFFAYGYFDRVFTLAGRSQPIFFGVYAGVLMVSLATGLLLSRVLQWQSSYAWILPTIAVHVVLVSSLLMLMLRHARDVDV